MREEERDGERRKERRNMERDGEISIYIYPWIEKER